MKLRIAAFVLVASALVLAPKSVLAIPSTELSPIAELTPEIEQALDEMFSELLTPGPPVPDWNSSGTLIEGSTPAGTYLLGYDKDGEKSLTIVGQAPTENIIPSTWTLVGEVGRLALPAPGSDIYVAHMDGPFFMVAQSHSRRVGNAYCSAGTANVRLYEVPGIETESEIDRQALNFFVAMAVRRLEKYEVCARYDTAASGYRLRYFLPNGRSLPALDDFEERIVIVPPAPIEQLLLNQ